MLLADLRSCRLPLAATALAATALLSGCTPDTSGASGSGSVVEAEDLPVGTADQEPSAAGARAVGELLGDDGSRKLRVAGVECGIAAVGTAPDVLTASGGQFCRVDVDLLNPVGEGAAFAVTSVSGTTSTGPVAADARANTYAGGSPVLAVPSGTTTTASAYLDVPPGAGVQTVVVQRGWLDDDVAVVVG